jgi:peptide/nickel transport system permease protein
VAGYRGGRADWMLMRLADVALGFPLFIMAMAIIAVIGRGLTKALVAGVVVWWAQYARLMRASVLTVRDLQYVEAARTVGLSDFAIVRSYVFPNAITPIVVKITFDLARVILLLTGLSFLGLGTLPPAPEWGVIITESRSYILQAWWYPTFPGVAIAVSCLGLNLLGDSLATALDPRQR